MVALVCEAWVCAEQPWNWGPGCVHAFRWEDCDSGRGSRMQWCQLWLEGCISTFPVGVQWWQLLWEGILQYLFLGSGRSSLGSRQLHHLDSMAMKNSGHHHVERCLCPQQWCRLLESSCSSFHLLGEVRPRGFLLAPSSVRLRDGAMKLNCLLHFSMWPFCLCAPWVFAAFFVVFWSSINSRIF